MTRFRSWGVVAGVVTVTGGAVWTLRQMRRELVGDDGLRGPTVAAMYALYVIHASAVVAGALRAPNRFAIAGAPAVGAGLVCSTAGSLMTVAGMTRFTSARHISGMEDEALITDGIYRWSRHPQYVGYSLVLAGVVIASRSVRVAAVAAAYPAVIAWWAPIEEAELEEQYGDEYRRYRETTPRWFGLPARRRTRR